MLAVFSGERITSDGSPSDSGANAHSPPGDVYNMRSAGKEADPSQVRAWLELWDYAGGCSFRGFVADEGADKSLFAFFNSDLANGDLKKGLMALIELAETVFDCSQLVICLDRGIDADELKALVKSLRWVGLQLVTLEMWAKQRNITSDKWLLLGMEV